MFFFALEVIFSQAIIAETSCPSLSHAEEERGTNQAARAPPQKSSSCEFSFELDAVRSPNKE